MNVIQGRHAFWSVPRPMFTNGPLRTIPISMGRQFVGLSAGPFLGQNELFLGQSETRNRLEYLNIAAIQNRILIAPALIRFQEELAAARQRQQQWRRYGGEAASAMDLILASNPSLEIPALTSDERTVLELISQDPTSDELGDLATISGFFPNSLTSRNQHQPDLPLTSGVCAALKSSRPIEIPGAFGRGRALAAAEAVAAWLTYSPPRGRGWGASTPTNATSDELDDIKGSDFFCGAAKDLPDVVAVNFSGVGNYAGFFGIDPNQPWGNIKLQVQNAIIIMDAILSYPLPPPIDLYAPQFWVSAAGDIQTMVKIGGPLDPEAVRHWITLFVIANYNAMTDRIEADLKRKSKKAKRKMILKIVGLVVVGVVASFLLPAVIVAIVSTIKTAVDTYIEIQKRKEAAKQMMDAAKLFEKDAPAFASEVEKTAKLLDEVAASEQGNMPLSPEMQAAMQEVDAETPGISPLIPIGGIAASALAAFLIFR